VEQTGTQRFSLRVDNRVRASTFQETLGELRVRRQAFWTVCSVVLNQFGTSGVLIAWVNAVSERVSFTKVAGQDPGFEQLVAGA
jgi:hypothetical protein